MNSLFVLFSYCSTQEIHGLLKLGVSADSISSKLSPWASALFEFMPPFIKKQVLIFYLSSYQVIYNAISGRVVVPI